MNLPDFTNPEWFKELINSIELTPEVITGIAVIAIFFGLLTCFFGYPLFRLVLGIFAGVVGAISSYTVASSMFGVETDGMAASIICALTVGVLVTIALVKLYLIGVFLIGAGLAVFLAMTITTMLDYIQVPLALAISGVVGGLIALWLQKLIVVISTAVFGSLYAVVGVAQLAGFGFDLEKMRENPEEVVNWQEPDNRLIVMAVSVLVLAIIGMIAQYKISSAMKAHHGGGNVVNVSKREEENE
jgi:MFS family permease